MTGRAAFRRAIERHDLDELLAEVQPRLMAAIRAEN